MMKNKAMKALALALALLCLATAALAEAGDWWTDVLSEEAEYSCYALVDVNGDGAPALILSTTEDSFIGAEDKGALYLCHDGEPTLAMEVGGAGGEIFYFNPEEDALTYFSRLSGEAHIVVYHVTDGALEPAITADTYQPGHYPEEDNKEPVYLRDGEAITEADADALWALYADEAFAVAYQPIP